MQAGRADSGNRARDNRKYAADRPGDCKHCYFWKGKRKGCSQKECYYLLPEDIATSETVTEEVFHQKSDENRTGNCQGCPYGRHVSSADSVGSQHVCHWHTLTPCIGYCMKKILREMREKKQSAGKEGERLAGRGK